MAINFTGAVTAYGLMITNFGKTISRTPVTKTTDNITGDETLSNNLNSGSDTDVSYASDDPLSGSNESAVFNGTTSFIAMNNLGVMTTAGTIMCWVKLDTAAADGIIMANIVNSNERFVMGVRSGGAIYANRYDGASHGKQTSNLSTGTWYHVTFTSDGSNEYIYINGVNNDGGTGIMPSARATDNLIFGKREDDNSYLDGSVAYARAWNVMLTEAEAVSEMNSSTPVKTEYLLGNWSLNGDSTEEPYANGAFFRKEDDWVQDKPGLIQNADAVLMVKPGVSVNKDDKLTYDSEDYRVDKVVTRRYDGTSVYQVAQCFKI